MLAHFTQSAGGIQAVHPFQPLYFGKVLAHQKLQLLQNVGLKMQRFSLGHQPLRFGAGLLKFRRIVQRCPRNATDFNKHSFNIVLSP